MSDEKPPLTDAIRHLAEQDRRSLSDHPSPATLAAYHAGELTPEAEARLREHLALCRHCSDLLLDLAGFADLAPPPGVAELTDAEVEADWQALQERMREKAAAVVPIRRPSSPSPMKPDRELLPWKLIAAAAMIAAVGLFAWNVQLNNKYGVLLQPRIPLGPDSIGVERGDSTTKISASEDGVFYMIPAPEHSAYLNFQLEIVRAEGDKPVSEPAEVNFKESPRFVPVLIPRGSLQPGSYKALLYGIQNGSKEISATQIFEIDGS